MNDRISVRGINPEVLKEFKKYVESKYGKLHTVMGQELEKAIISYLNTQESQECARAHKKKEPIVLPSPYKKNPSKGKFETVKNEFIRNTADAEEFQRYYAERLIKERMNVYDPRSIERYCSELYLEWELR